VRGLAGYLAFRAMTGFVGILPERLMRGVGRIIGWGMWRRAGDKRLVVAKHMARASGAPPAEAERLVKRMFSSYGRYWAEVFWIRPRRRDAFARNADVEGLEILHAAAKEGKGMIYALGHTGNWDAAAAKSWELGYPVVAVAEKLSNRRIRQWFLKVRAAFGIEVVLADRGSGVTRRLLEELRSGGTVALVCDRDLGGDGIEVEFFGETTTLPAGPVALADRTGAALLPVGCYFKKGRGHRLVVNPPIEIPQLDKLEDRIAAGTQLLAQALEAVISQIPHQWHLTQPNWPSDRAAI